MHVLSTTMWRVYLFVAYLRWQAFALILLAHLIVTYVGLWLCGESELGAPITFFYFYATTAATVGYGDFAPSSDGGRLFTAIWVFPGALVMFTTVLAKLTTSFASIWRRRMDGYGDYSHLKGATVIVAHHPKRIERMIDEIIAGKAETGPLVLVSRQPVPLDEDTAVYVRAETLSGQRDLVRAGVANAERVIVYADDDEATLAAALAVAALNEAAHLVVYFSDQRMANLLQAHCEAACVVSQSVELVVREMQDPGTSRVMAALSAVGSDHTVFSFVIPEGAGTTFGALFDALHHKLDATLVATSADEHEPPNFGGDRAAKLGAGDWVYYIRSHRLGPTDIQTALAGGGPGG